MTREVIAIVSEHVSRPVRDYKPLAEVRFDALIEIRAGTSVRLVPAVHQQARSSPRTPLV